MRSFPKPTPFLFSVLHPIRVRYRRATSHALSPSLSVDLAVFFLVLCRLGIRVRVRISLGLGLTRFIFLSVWVRLNPLIFSCRAPAKTVARHLSPHGGGGDRQLSDARHPPSRSLFIFFYPVRVRVRVSIRTGSNPLLLFDFFSILYPILDLHTGNPASIPLL